MSPDSVPLELVADLHNVIGEGPVWLEDEQRLVWVDIKSHRVQWLDPETGHVEQLDVGADVGAVAPTMSGNLIAAIGNGFQLIDRTSGRTDTVAAAEPHQPENRMNDGKCDSRGRFWAGSMANDEAPGAGALYRLNLDHTVDRVLSDVTVSNGLDWTDDDRLMYYIDSLSYCIDGLDFEPSAGTVTNRRPLIRIEKGDGLPDGMTLDSKGGIWVALVIGVPCAGGPCAGVCPRIGSAAAAAIAFNASRRGILLPLTTPTDFTDSLLPCFVTAFSSV